MTASSLFRTPREQDAFARELAQVASSAAVAVMEVYATDFETRTKADHSPVSDADERAEEIILTALERLAPGVPVVAEESADKWRGDAWEGASRFFLVDPVDGTKEFIKRNGQFTVNIGLIENGAPTAGVVYAPALEEMFYAGAVGRVHAGLVAGSEIPRDAEAMVLKARVPPRGGLTAIVSNSHLGPETRAYLARHTVAETLRAGSSLKFCRIAQGAADIYPRFGPTMEWDVAAGHAVLQAAGGSVTGPEGTPFRYGNSDRNFRNAAFVARGLAA
ncbi:3'(2'),5'-bisphosphate nucleotidase CysQ [bacterium]|nr:3'(2'),5'-bisphosphate nucleotidase CysQ [bacterium]